MRADPRIPHTRVVGQCPLGSVASNLCHFILTCSCMFQRLVLMTGGRKASMRSISWTTLRTCRYFLTSTIMQMTTRFLLASQETTQQHLQASRARFDVEKDKRNRNLTESMQGNPIVDIPNEVLAIHIRGCATVRTLRCTSKCTFINHTATSKLINPGSTGVQHV